MKIVCRTLFDCSHTGITGHFRPSEIPFTDQAGKTITDLASWHRSRNQQRNWETLMQIISLRTQPQDITRPMHNNGVWEFEFVGEANGVYSTIDDPVGGLKQDCHGVPMVVNLNEQAGVTPTLVVDGNNQNIWFEPINNILE